jgi:hypothetical protein
VGDFAFELDDGVLAVLEVGDGFPGGFLEGEALPLDEVVRGVVDASPPDDLLDFPLVALFAHRSLYSIMESHIIIAKYQRILSFSAKELIFCMKSCFCWFSDSIWLLIFS